ncbi:hypothetical protein M0Q50_09630 [bacterium]|jgi:NifU-like protein involved in Fe-S cluster formation|nr:hypothetical protein [bacterium]
MKNDDIIKYYIEKIYGKIKTIKIIDWPNHTRAYYETICGDEFSLKIDMSKIENVREEYINTMRINKLKSL